MAFPGLTCAIHALTGLEASRSLLYTMSLCLDMATRGVRLHTRGWVVWFPSCGRWQSDGILRRL